MSVLTEGKITKEGLDELRQRLGTLNRTSSWGVGIYNEYASKDTIRHFCQGIGDMNPLWLDREYAFKSPYGRIVAPPCFLYSVYWPAGRVGGLPGVHAFHSGNDWRFYEPIYEGTRFIVEEQFVDVVEKESQFAGRIVQTHTVATYRDDNGKVIAQGRGWTTRAERDTAREKAKYKEEEEPYKYTEAEIEAIEKEIMAEERRGAIPRFWEDVAIGEELKPVVKGPMSHGDITAWEIAALGGLAHGWALTEFKKHPAWMYRDPVTGAAEAVIKVHAVAETAKSAGLPRAYDYGCQRISWMGHLLNNWVGDHGSVERLYAELRRFNYVGDTTWCKGKVTAKRKENGKNLIDLDVWTENQRNLKTTVGKATVSLMSKEPRMIVIP
jgi:acyl dehydratase